MFTKMRMTNFKSWVDTGEVRLAPLTGFFGTNSSGKSSLLQMLLLLKQTTESQDRNLVLKTGSSQNGYINLGTPHEIIHGDQTQMSLSVSWNLPSAQSHLGGPIPIDVPDGDRSVKVDHLDFETHIYAELQKIHVLRLAYACENRFGVQLERKNNNQYVIDIQIDGKEPRRAQGRPRVYMKPQKCYGFSDEALRYYQDTDFLSDIVLRFEQQFRRVHHLGPIREYPERIYTWGGERPSDVGLKGEYAIAALLSDRTVKVYPSVPYERTKLEERIAAWLVELGLAASFRTHQLVHGGAQYEVRLRRHKDSPEVLITDLGIGVSQLLPVLVLCYYAPEGSTIILEQPELHLHPAVQSGLADVLLDVIQKRNVQIVIESHSEHLLRRIQRRVAEDQVQTDEIALYFCDLQNGESKMNQLQIDHYGNISNWPQGFFGDMTGDMFEIAQAGIRRKYS